MFERGEFQHAIVSVFVLSVHVVLVGVVMHQKVALAPPLSGLESLAFVTVSAPSRTAPISPLIFVRERVVTDLSVEPPRLDWTPEVDDELAMTQGNGRMKPPHPTGPLIDPLPFARRAGLQAGSGATVVVRVEVRGNGTLGRVEVEVSGGSPDLDQSAIAYVHALTWIGGSVDDRPQTIWIRWGVRFDGE